MKARVEEFLTRGVLGEIRVGVSPTLVLEQLGPPQGESVMKTPIPIWLYGNVQIHHSAAAVEMLAVFLGVNSPPPWATIVFEGWTPPREMSCHDFETYLTHAGIEWRVDGSTSSDCQTSLHVGKGDVVVHFVENRIESMFSGGSNFVRRMGEVEAERQKRKQALRGPKARRKD